MLGVPAEPRYYMVSNLVWEFAHWSIMVETARRVADPATRLRAEAFLSSPSASFLSASVSSVSFSAIVPTVAQSPSLVPGAAYSTAA